MTRLIFFLPKTFVGEGGGGGNTEKPSLSAKEDYIPNKNPIKKFGHLQATLSGKLSKNSG